MSCSKRTTESDAFYTAIRYYNNAFSFTLLGADLDKRLLQVTGTGHYAFRAHGQLYHRIGALYPMDKRPPAFAQLYIFDSKDEQLSYRAQAFTGLDLASLRKIQDTFHAHYPLVQFFKTNAEHIWSNNSINMSISLNERPIDDSY